LNSKQKEEYFFFGHYLSQVFVFVFVSNKGNDTCHAGIRHGKKLHISKALQLTI
jgi:hypothetical protein